MMMTAGLSPHVSLAVTITGAASRQTDYTIRFLVDRQRVAEAYCAYAYFRWVDDTLDADSGTSAGRSAFLVRQQELLEACYRREPLEALSAEEQMLAALVRQDREPQSGLQAYLRNMMAVMAFDAGRRGRVISQAELDEYTHNLSSAVTEAMHYFIGHCCYSPHDEARYLAVSAAHITHMLRDTWDDLQAGYFNIPAEILEARQITPQDITSPAYCAWVRERVQLARACFQVGKTYLSRVQSWRCRLAGLAYTARFERLLDTIEGEAYVLRPQYSERKSWRAALQMAWLMLASLATAGRNKLSSRTAAMHVF